MKSIGMYNIRHVLFIHPRTQAYDKDMDYFRHSFAMPIYPLLGYPAVMHRLRCQYIATHTFLQRAATQRA